MKILLIGNYQPDGQHSMARFADILMQEYENSVAIEAEWITPTPILGKGRNTLCGFAKWLGYFDKYVLFPRRLKRIRKNYDLIHICDHSNAVYTRFCKPTPTVVTCHDMLAVRGGLGEDTDCPASFMGRQLQRAILRGLNGATALISVSRYTQNDIHRLLPGFPRNQSFVVPNGLNAPFRRIPNEQAQRNLPPVEGWKFDEPFLLHVGSNLKRKNKAVLIRAMELLKNRWSGSLLLAGPSMNPEIRSLVYSLGLEGRVFEVARPTFDQLLALYNLAYAFVFPSRFEGFGWPVIEAQACGCPLICSNWDPLPEVSGAHGLMVDPNKETEIAEAVLALENASVRDEVSRNGLENASQYNSKNMACGYLEAYHQVLQKS